MNEPRMFVVYVPGLPTEIYGPYYSREEVNEKLKVLLKNKHTCGVYELVGTLSNMPWNGVTMIESKERNLRNIARSILEEFPETELVP